MNRYEAHMATSLAARPQPTIQVGTKLKFLGGDNSYTVTAIRDDHYLLIDTTRVSLDLQCMCGCNSYMEVCYE